MTPAAQGQSTEEVDGGGLDFGLSAWHVRALCENPWNSGAGYTPQQVGEMTPDQVYMRLCEMDRLKQKGTRVIEMEADGAMSLADKDGMVKGRLADGTVVYRPLRVRGKTVAQQVREQS